MPKTIKQSLASDSKGFYIGHRLILPFRCQVLKIIVDGHIFTEMVGSDHIKLQQDSKNTSIYFRYTGKLDNHVGTYKVVKLIVAEWESDLCDMGTHIKLVCEIGEKHEVTIHEPNDDMLFIE